MNAMHLEELEPERDFASTAEEEDDGDAEALYRDGPEARRARLGIARQQHLESLRGRRPRTARRAPISRQDAAATRIANLERQVRSLAQATAASRHSAERAGLAIAGTAVTGQFFRSFPTAVPKIVADGLQVAPVMLLAPQKHRSGFVGWLSDPRVLTVGLFAGIMAAQHGKVFHRAKDFTISAPDMPDGVSTVQLDAFRVDSTGAVVAVSPVTWGALTPAKATIDKSGKVTRIGTAKGQATFSAMADGLVKTATITLLS